MALEAKGGGGPKSSASHVSHAKAADYFREAIEYVTKSQSAKTVYDALERLVTKIPVEVIHDNNDFYSHAYAGGGYIHWDPLSALQVTEGGWQSPAVGLIHEMYHAYQEFVLKDIYPNMPQKMVSVGAGAGGGSVGVSKEEVATVVFEQNVCKELGKLGFTNETPRLTYARVTGTADVTSVTSTGKA
ncbi:MAG TPA: hypothetical protein VH639_17605 [Bryobacteraceae bacterium]|jgi:hypothetical protein